MNHVVIRPLGFWLPRVAAMTLLGGALCVHAAEKSDKVAEGALPLHELRAFAEIFGRIKTDYVEPVEDKVLLEHAIRGMLAGLDPHSTFLNEEDYKQLQEGTSGSFGGLGIEVGMEDGFVKIIAPIDDTPAARAGIQTGDIIIRIDGQSVKGMTLNDAVKLMRGAPGTEIKLLISRQGQDKPLDITLKRDRIQVASVKGRMLEPGFGYLRISQFQTNTSRDMLKQLDKLKEENKGPLNGLVLDLRNNPGGILNGAVAVSDAFLESGLIVYTKGRTDDSKFEFSAGPDDVLQGAPIVTIVNGGSASASEIVAGALQDHKRSLIIGETTFGKGSVQSVMPINSSMAVKLTTARYYTPSGRSIQAEGIKPDIQVPQVQVKVKETDPMSQIKEENLTHHLENNKARKDNQKDAEQPLVERDYPLSQGLNLLKGLARLRKSAGSA